MVEDCNKEAARGSRGEAPRASRVLLALGIVLLALTLGWVALCAYRAAMLGAAPAGRASRP